MDIKALQANYKPVNIAATQPKKTSGRGGPLTAFISEGGAAGGALGGAALGTAILPGIGTVVGAGLGGLLGGFTGKAAETKIRDDKVDWGSAAREGAISGVTSAILPGGGAGVLGKNAAKTAAKQAESAAAAKIAQEAEKQALKKAQGSAVGHNVMALLHNRDVDTIAGKAAEAARFNDLAKQNIKNVAKERATQGLPLANNGGVLVQPGAVPSFASEGVELLPVPKVPGKISYSSIPATPAATTGTVATDIAEAGAAKAPSIFSKFADKTASTLTKKGSGLKVGNNVGDINRLDDLTETLQRLNITGTPTQQLRKISDVMASHSASVDDILTKTPIKVNGADIKAQVAKAIKDPTKFAELDLTNPSTIKALDVHLGKFATATNAKEVNDYIKVLNPIASEAREKLARGATLTSKQEAALAAKKAGDEVLSQFPEIKPFKTDMARLFDLNPQIAKESEKAAGMPMLGIKMRDMQQVGDAVASKTGKGLSNAATIMDKFATGTAMPRRVGAQMFSVGTANTIVDGLTGADQDENKSISQATIPSNNNATTIPASIDNIPKLSPQSSENTSNSGVDMSGAIDQAIMQALAAGDTKGLQNLLSVADYYDKKQAALLEAAGADKPLSAESSKTIANANSGLQSLDQIEQMLADDPSLLKKTAIPGRGLGGGILANATGTAKYDTIARNISDVITRLRTGAALTDQESKFYNSQLPQAFDSPDVVQQKLQMFRDLFSSVANRTGSPSTDIAALVAQ